MYARSFIPGGVLLTPLREMPQRFHTGAYSLLTTGEQPPGCRGIGAMP